MRSRSRLVLLAAALGALASCDEPKPFVRAFQSTGRDQLIGGIAAIGDVGDYVLENDQVRFVVLDGHGSPGPGIFGGSLADADLQRPEPEFRNGHGLDSLSEIFPMANLTTPNPEASDVTIEETGDDGQEAVIRVSAPADNYLRALEILKQGLGVPMNLRLTTRYRLVPGSRVLEIETGLEFDQNGGAREATDMTPLAAPPNIFDTILRVPGGSNKTAPGAVAGDFLFYGNKTDVFTPGYGFDIDHKFREIFNGGCDSVNVPLGLDAVAAEADRVSYAYASADETGGRTYVPLFASSFTAVITHAFTCTSSLPCLGDKRLTYKRYFAVGDGDAASALTEIQKAKHVAVGTVNGHVHDARTGIAVSGARVLVLRDPGTSVISDERLAAEAPEALLEAVYEANRASSKSCPTDKPASECARCARDHDPFGEPGIVTSMKTDRGTDRVLDGDFRATLPPGTYLLVARTRERPTTRPARIVVGKDSTVSIDLALEPAASLEVHVTDERGRPSPGKVTLGRCLSQCASDADCADGATCDTAQRRCFPKDRCASGTCASYERCTDTGCECRPYSAMDVALGDPLLPDNVVGTAFAGADGIARIAARPGDYELLTSRGIEYDLDRKPVSLAVSRPLRTDAAVHRVVDTTGYISGDFHVHGIASHDAYVTHEARVTSMMAEGVELLSSSDHDALTDFEPAVRALRAQEFIKTQVGVESTTVEMGHFIGHPLRYDLLAGGPGLLGKTGGAFDWQALPPGPMSYCDSNGDGAFDRYGERLVREGDPDKRCGSDDVGNEPGIMGRIRKLSLYDPNKTVVTVPHPRDGFFGYFDQFELDPYTLQLGGSLLELLNPLIKPETFSTNFDAIELFNGKRLDFVRTPSIDEITGFTREMRELRARGLSSDEYERSTGAIADRWVRRILERTPAEQRAILDHGANVACTPKLCDALGQCGANEVCTDDAASGQRVCLQKCTAVTSCNAANGTCDLGAGVCRRDPTAPCTDHRGVIDDWFRLLNAGARITGVGNSDTHTLLSGESGLPRNFVASDTDEPRAIDIGQVAENMLAHQVVASYGPFVRMDVNGTPIGGTLERPSGPVQVHVSVESPLWFDVDRLELYRNGELWKVVDAGTTDAACSVIDAVPNKSVVHFDCRFEDTPAKDSWYVAIALGLRGKDLRPVYTSVPILSLEIGDITSRAFGAISGFGALASKPAVPRQNSVLPMAITNPIWVDTLGDGFDPPAPAAAPSPFAAKGTLGQPLSQASMTAPVLPSEEPDEAHRARLLAETLRRRLERAFEAHHHRPAGLDER